MSNNTVRVMARNISPSANPRRQGIEDAYSAMDHRLPQDRIGNT